MKIKNYYYFAFLLLGFFLLIARTSGIYPVVADEWVYSQASRLFPIREATIPGYLYLWVYKGTSYCGDGFLNCARALNSLFFVLSAPFIYLITRQVASSLVSVFVVFLSLVGPINSYTIYFMPDAFYFLAFWVLSWYILSEDKKFTPQKWLFIGVLIAIAALIKPHALFLIPPILLYLIITQKGYCGYPLLIKNTCLLLFGIFSTKFLLGYLWAGVSGITFFGPSYGSAATSTVANSERYFILLKLAIQSFSAHVLVIGTFYSLPFAYISALFLNSIFTKNVSSNQERISLFLLLILMSLIVIVALFTASIVNMSPYESVFRLHMRYYNFCLPFFLIIAASLISEVPASNTTKFLGRLFGALLVLGVLYSLYTQLKIYAPYFVDAPELSGFMANPWMFTTFCILSIASVCLWILNFSFGAKAFIFIYAPLLMVFSGYFVNKTLLDHRHPDEYDRSAVVVKNLLNNEQLSKLHVVGSDPGLMHLTLFQLDNAKVSIDYIPKDAEYHISQAPQNKEWILVIGRHKISGAKDPLTLNGFSLIKLPSSLTIDFKQGAWPGAFKSVSGLGSPEAIGTWSDSSTVLLEFNSALPHQFKLSLQAYAFGPNTKEKFILISGVSSQEFSLGDTSKTVELVVNNPKFSSVVEIKIPHPVAPKDLGLNGDERKLGMALQKITIIPIEAN